MLPPDKPSCTMVLASDAATRSIIDVADGIDRIMGNRELYQRMLNRFRSDYRHGTLPIGHALVRGDRALAHRLAHTIKGSAGMIGAHVLHAEASALEVVIRTGDQTQPQELAALDTALEQVLEVIDRLLLQGRQHEAATMAQPEAPRTLLADPALLARLVELLVSGDGAAVDLLEESGTSLKVVLGEARLRQVADAVHAFDFDGALLALRQTASDAAP